jgi:hypothetical protein
MVDQDVIRVRPGLDWLILAFGLGISPSLGLLVLELDQMLEPGFVLPRLFLSRLLSSLGLGMACLL